HLLTQPILPANLMQRPADLPGERGFTASAIAGFPGDRPYTPFQAVSPASSPAAASGAPQARPG
ncbi:MAG: hypothetical protein LBV44_05385, partial [Methylobacillus sp.]|nr:hypothetical protein [Methylobacillus sp.]